MPVVRITLKKGKTPEYLAAISDSLYAVMLEHYALAEGDKFHIFEQLDSSSLIYDRNYAVTAPRTDDFMIVEIISDARRAVEKHVTIKAICDRLGVSPGIKPQDVVVILGSNSTLEDFSLGEGVSATTPAG